MCIKRITISVIAVTAFVMGLECFAHGYMLKDLYQQTSSLWRGESEFLMHYMTLSQVEFAIFV